MRDNIRLITNNYIPQNQGSIVPEVSNLLSNYREKQNLVLDSANELDDSFNQALSMLDDNDKQGFLEYTKKIKDDLSSYSSSNYVGNLDRKLRNDANKFKNTFSVFKDNTDRRRKFIEDLSKASISDDKKQMYLNYIDKNNGKIEYDPITGSIKNRFRGIDIIKEPEVENTVKLYDNKIPTVEEIFYKTPNGKISKEELPNSSKIVNKRRVVGKDIAQKINNSLMTDPNYRTHLSRNRELGGEEYAQKEHNRFLQSVLEGLSIGDFNTSNYEMGDIAKHSIKKEIDSAYSKKERDDISKEKDIVSNFGLPTPMNKKMNNYEGLEDVVKDINLNKEKGNTQKANDIGNYLRRLESKLGIEYGKDYEATNILGVNSLSVKNDKAKQRIRMANDLIKKDAESVTSYYRPFSFNDKSSNDIMDRSLQNILGSLPEGDALYTPMNVKTNEPLEPDEVKNLKNIKFNNAELTSKGIYFLLRSEGTDKDRGNENSSDYDKLVRLKVPHERVILSNLVKLNKITAPQADAYLKLQGLDDNFGNYKTINVKGKNITVKKLLPSDEKGNGYFIKEGNNNSIVIPSFEELVDFIANKQL